MQSKLLASGRFNVRVLCYDVIFILRTICLIPSYPILPFFWSIGVIKYQVWVICALVTSFNWNMDPFAKKGHPEAEAGMWMKMIDISKKSYLRQNATKMQQKCNKKLPNDGALFSATTPFFVIIFASLLLFWGHWPTPSEHLKQHTKQLVSLVKTCVTVRTFPHLVM